MTSMSDIILIARGVFLSMSLHFVLVQTDNNKGLKLKYIQVDDFRNFLVHLASV